MHLSENSEPLWSLCEWKATLVTPETYLSSIHKKNQWVRIRNGRHGVNEAQTWNKCPTDKCICSSISDRAEQYLGHLQSLRSLSQWHSPTLLIYSQPCLPGPQRLGTSACFSFWHKWVNNPRGFLQSKTGFLMLGLDSGAHIWKTSFKLMITITPLKWTSLWGRILLSTPARLILSPISLV